MKSISFRCFNYRRRFWFTRLSTKQPTRTSLGGFSLTRHSLAPFVICLSSLLSPLSYALNVKPGSPLVRGNPSIIVESENGSLDDLIVLRRNSEDSNWKTLKISDYQIEALSDNTFRLLDKSVTVSSYAPTEYQYKVTNTQGSDSTWTASCENYDENTNPMQSWINKINANPFHAGSNTYTLKLTSTGAPDEIVIPPPSETITYSKQKGFYVLSNDQYVAIFSGYGGLLAFTHRSYGMEFQTSLRNPWISPFSARYGCDKNDANCTQPGQWQVAPNVSPPANGNGELVFEWVLNNANVKVIWSLKSFSRPGLHARLEVLNGNDSFERIGFPLLIGLGYNQSCYDGSDPGQCYTLYRPGNTSGVAELLNTPRAGTYQTSSLMAQFTAIAHENVVLYIGAEDPSGFPKKYTFYPTGKTGGSGVEHYLRDNYEIDAAHAYDVVLRPMCGSWEKAAKMYRQWALVQEWAPEKLFVRSDVSEDLKAGMFWWTHNNGTSANLTQNLNYLQQTLKPLLRDMDSEGKLRLGIHHYNWHTPEFDHGYPEYIPKCFAGTSCSTTDWISYQQQAQQDGQTWEMPYINATNIDVSNMPPELMSSACLNNTPDPIYGIWGQEWPAGSGKILSDDMVTQKNGKPSTASYSTLQCLGQMDLNSSTWQSIVGNLASVNFSSGVAAQYLDTLGGVYSANYSNVDPSYQPGHSNYGKNGTRAIADLVKAIGTTYSNAKFTAAEHYSELFLKNIDLFTMYSDQPPSLVPLLPAVYSGYHNVAGMQLRQGDYPQARKYRLSMPFIWGYQLGLTSMNQLVGINPSSQNPCNIINHSTCDYSSAVYAFNLAKARENMTFILTHGEYMGAILPVSAADYLTVNNWCQDQGCSIKTSPKFPLLQAAYWRDMSGGDVIVVTNPTENSQTLDLGLPMALRGRGLRCLNHNGTPNNCLNSIKPTSISVSVEPLSVVYLTVGIWSDLDGDLISSDFDNCPTIANPNQTDIDNNGVGDACQHGLTGTYYNNKNLYGTPALVTIDPEINFNWGTGRPNSSVGTNSFSIGWTGRVLPPVSGTYKFCTTTDDGVTLKINNVLLVNKWVKQSAKPWCGAIALTQNQPVSIEMNYFEDGGSAVAKLLWAYPTGNETPVVIPTSQLYAQ